MCPWHCCNLAGWRHERVIASWLGKTGGESMLARRLAAIVAIALCASCVPVKHVPVRIPASAIQRNTSYPTAGMRMMHQGIVVLLILVDEKGHVSDIRVSRSSGFRELDKAAIESAGQWLFNPATVDGVPTASYVNVPVNFHLNHIDKAPQPNQFMK
jgi:TonB family protein